MARAIARTLSFGGDDATRDFPKGGSVSSGLENNNNANTSLPFLSGGATTEDEDRKQDLNLQPHLNVALRQELLYFTRLGILHSIRKFRKLEHSKDHELQQRSHSSRYLLRRDVRSFDRIGIRARIHEFIQVIFSRSKTNDILTLRMHNRYPQILRLTE